MLTGKTAKLIHSCRWERTRILINSFIFVIKIHKTKPVGKSKFFMFYNINIKIDSYHLRTIDDLVAHRNVQNRRSDLLTNDQRGFSKPHS